MRFLKTPFSTIVATIFIVAAIAQTPDIQISTRGPYPDLARGVTWANAAAAYVMSPPTPSSSLCVGIHNLSATSHNFTVSVYITMDSRQRTYSDSLNKWLQVGLSSASTVTGLGQYSEIWSQCYPTFGAARVTVVVSGTTGSTDKVDVFASWNEGNNFAFGASGSQVWAFSTSNQPITMAPPGTPSLLKPPFKGGQFFAPQNTVGLTIANESTGVVIGATTNAVAGSGAMAAGTKWETYGQRTDPAIGITYVSVATGYITTLPGSNNFYGFVTTRTPAQDVGPSESATCGYEGNGIGGGFYYRMLTNGVVSATYGTLAAGTNSYIDAAHTFMLRWTQLSMAYQVTAAGVYSGDNMCEVSLDGGATWTNLGHESNYFGWWSVSNWGLGMIPNTAAGAAFHVTNMLVSSH